VTYSFGHAMCVVPTSDAGAVAYRHLGFTVHVGGRHTIGTQNSVVPLQRGYLEVLSIYDEASARRSPRRRAIVEYIEREAGGLIGFALRTDTMEADVERLTDAGLAYGGPVGAERTTPGGTVLKWRVLRPTPQPCPALMPILVTGDASTPPFAGNPNTIAAAGGISVVSHDPQQLIDSYRVLLDGDPAGEKSRDDLGAVATVFEVDGFAIEILRPTGPGIATRTLDRQGAGPVELHLLADDLDAVAGPLGLAVSQNAVAIPPVLGLGLRILVTPT
jgi:hypothetical protein